MWAPETGDTVGVLDEARTEAVVVLAVDVARFGCLAAIDRASRPWVTTQNADVPGTRTITPIG